MYFQDLLAGLSVCSGKFPRIQEKQWWEFVLKIDGFQFRVL